MATPSVALRYRTRVVLFKRAVDKTPDLTPQQVADVIDKFIKQMDEGTFFTDDFTFEWDNYIHIPSRTPALEEIRRQCAEVDERFPDVMKEIKWPSQDMRDELMRLAQKARQLAQQSDDPSDA